MSEAAYLEVPGVGKMDDERFMVRSRLEIVSILRGLQEHRELVTAYFGDGRDFIVTMVLSVNPDFEEVVFDFGAQQKANARLMEATRIFFVSQLSHIRIQFFAGHADATTFESLPAFRVRIPAEVARLQRRQYYRVRVPSRLALACELPPYKQGAGRVRARVMNISCGGAALTDFPMDMPVQPGTRLSGCRLGLNDGEPIETTFEIVRMAEVPHAHGPAARMIGIQFVDLTAGARARIQRFINRVEREQISRDQAD